MLEQVWQFLSVTHILGWAALVLAQSAELSSSSVVPKGIPSTGDPQGEPRLHSSSESGWGDMSGIRSNGDQVTTCVKQSLECIMTRAGTQRALLAWPESSSICLAEGHDLSKLCVCHNKPSSSDRALLGTCCYPSATLQGEPSLLSAQPAERAALCEGIGTLLLTDRATGGGNLTENYHGVLQRDTQRHQERASYPDAGLGLSSIVNFSGEQRWLHKKGNQERSLGFGMTSQEVRSTSFLSSSSSREWWVKNQEDTADLYSTLSLVKFGWLFDHGSVSKISGLLTTDRVL